jgi:hypothetical protein
MLYFIWHVLCFYLQGIATSQQQQEQILEVLHGEEEAAHMEHVAHMEHEAPEEQVAHVEHEAPRRMTVSRMMVRRRRVPDRGEASSRSTTC